MCTGLHKTGSCPSFAQSLEQLLTHARRAGRVLTGDQDTAELVGVGNDDLLTPGLGCLGVFTAGDAVELILEREGHGVHHLRLVLFFVGKSGDGGALDERLARGGGRVDEDGGAVADRGDGLLGRGEGLNQGEGGWIRGEIEHGWFSSVDGSLDFEAGVSHLLTSMSTDVEDSIEFPGTRHHIGQAHGVLPQRLLVVQEADRGIVLLERLD
jgi:hypothetical protein